MLFHTCVCISWHENIDNNFKGISRQELKVKFLQRSIICYKMKAWIDLCTMSYFLLIFNIGIDFMKMSKVISKL